MNTETKPTDANADNPAETNLASQPLPPGASTSTIESPADTQENHSVESPAAKQGFVGKTQGFFKSIIARASGDLPPCNCKLPGQPGQHKATCPRRPKSGANAGTADRRFARPDLSSAGTAETNNELAGTMGGTEVSPLPPATPKNHSFYRRAISTLARGRAEFKVWRIQNRIEPILGHDAAVSEADKFAFSDKELTDLENSMEEAAKFHDWPEISPLGNVVMILGNYEIHAFAQSRALDRRLAKVQHAIEESNRLKRQQQQRAQQPQSEREEQSEQRQPAQHRNGAKAPHGPSAKELDLDRDNRKDAGE